jgi:hypothetical protein
MKRENVLITHIREDDSGVKINVIAILYYLNKKHTKEA